MKAGYGDGFPKYVCYAVLIIFGFSHGVVAVFVCSYSVELVEFSFLEVILSRFFWLVVGAFMFAVSILFVGGSVLLNVSFIFFRFTALLCIMLCAGIFVDRVCCYGVALMLIVLVALLLTVMCLLCGFY